MISIIKDDFQRGNSKSLCETHEGDKIGETNSQDSSSLRGNSNPASFDRLL